MFVAGLHRLAQHEPDPRRPRRRHVPERRDRDARASAAARAEDVVLGMRPEDVRRGRRRARARSTRRSTPSSSPGESVLVTVTLGGQQFSARGDRHLRCEIGDTVGLTIDPARTYLFDAATEERIRL